MSKGKYYATTAWRKKRKRALEEKGYRCEDCGTTKDAGATLHVHHQIKSGFGGNESIDHLQVLCEECHRDRHRSRRNKKRIGLAIDDKPSGQYLEREREILEDNRPPHDPDEYDMSRRHWSSEILIADRDIDGSEFGDDWDALANALNMHLADEHPERESWTTQQIKELLEWRRSS